jgi:hypothetical protein
MSEGKEMGTNKLNFILWVNSAEFDSTGSCGDSGIIGYYKIFFYICDGTIIAILHAQLQ